MQKAKGMVNVSIQIDQKTWDEIGQYVKNYSFGWVATKAAWMRQAINAKLEVDRKRYEEKNAGKRDRYR